jgi:S1-C subfamily serine protease
MIKKIKLFILGFSLGVFLFAAVLGGALVDRKWGISLLDRIFPRENKISQEGKVVEKVVNEESVVIDVAEKSAPSVVTVSISKVQIVPNTFGFSPFDPFGFFNLKPKKEKIEQDIGTGFVVDGKEELIVTNKHVVADAQASYKVITKNGRVFEVKNIYRDPTNDLAILKIEGANLPALELGNSDKLKVGQMAIAIGTALGEFRHSVTVGVISGLGRGITAGSMFEGYVERLDNVIQTDAAINPGNSGGPLLNSAGQVIGVNVAVARQGQNIGFAIPINVVKESLEIFKKTGQFNRPFLGVYYQMISRQSAILNEVPQGAYVRQVLENSPAAKAGIKEGDIITHIDGKRITEEKGGLAGIINHKKVGDEVEIKIWRDGQEKVFKVRLEARKQK